MQCYALVAAKMTASYHLIKAVSSRSGVDTVPSKLVIHIISFHQQHFAGRHVLLDSWHPIILSFKDYQDLICGLEQDWALWAHVDFKLWYVSTTCSIVIIYADNLDTIMYLTQGNLF
jgi:hypothetical protein